MNNVFCLVLNHGGLYVRLSPKEFLRRETAGEVFGLGAEAHQARLAAYCG